MRKLVLLGLVGLGAQLVDGALGMGYGVTSSTMLLIVGLSPALASASVHLAEVGTNLASGVSHWKLGNTDWKLVARLGVPGAIGAFLGATVLSNISTEAGQPVMAAILGALGIYILFRFAFRAPASAHATTSPHTPRFLIPLGLIGGFVDATGGGGWGPVSTTTLLSRGKTAPRTVIGSVDTSEFLVSLAASVGFLVGLGTAGIDLGIVAALLIGGLIAAPIAAWLVSRLPARIMGTAVGGLIVLTNLRTLFQAFDITGVAVWIGYGLVLALWVGLITVAIRKYFAEKLSAKETPVTV
ncbi:sulfite exporter TauE/SafE family protein [Granulicoccus phenolivorans]|uniref:sulfite exporter TauE/SafE family protein n=1 Tax=Granulicoccus phenolivorans TaxID=266854 RepID=UPI000427C79E|nr:sulfite exporter TauE/SafE family protein [Granulicoccus phenolivorans]